MFFRSSPVVRIVSVETFLLPGFLLPGLLSVFLSAGCAMSPEREKANSENLNRTPTASAETSTTPVAAATPSMIASAEFKTPKAADKTQAEQLIAAKEQEPAEPLVIRSSPLGTGTTEIKLAPAAVPSPETHVAGSPAASEKKLDFPFPVTAPVDAASVKSGAATEIKTAKNDQVDPETSLRWLQHGNLRFVKHNLRDDGASPADRARLAEMQHPHAVILACSDSRVPPEIVFDQKLGEVLVVRTAGESIDQASLASIEDAVDHLGARLVLILGHESCDTVQAAIKTADQKGLSPAMAATLESIKTRFANTDFLTKERDVATLNDSAKISEANTTGAAHELLQRSEVLKRLVGSGQVQIHTALYHMKTGAVTFY